MDTVTLQKLSKQMKKSLILSINVFNFKHNEKIKSPYYSVKPLGRSRPTEFYLPLSE